MQINPCSILPTQQPPNHHAIHKHLLGILAASPLHREGARDWMMGRSSVKLPVKSTLRAMSKLLDATAKEGRSNRGQV